VLGELKTSMRTGGGEGWGSGADGFPGIEDVQGRGGTYAYIPKLDVFKDLGKFGGMLGDVQAELAAAYRQDIADAQARAMAKLAESLSSTDTSVSDSTGTDTSIQDQIRELQLQQLMEANARLRVGALQMPVFQDLAAAQQSFHGGGVVSGYGDQPVLARGGEGIFTEEQMRAMGGTGTTHFTFIIEDGAVNGEKIKRLAADGTREQISDARRRRR
jgi:hypothetical protein